MIIRPKKHRLPILLFDENCTLCNRFKLSLQRIEGTKEINFISIHNNSFFNDVSELDASQCHQEIHYIDLGGAVFRGSEAIKKLIKINPTVSKFAWLAESKIGEKSIDFFYNVANKCRESLLNRCDNCKKGP